MQTQDDLLRGVHLGFDEQNVYLRVDLREGMRAADLLGRGSASTSTPPRLGRRAGRPSRRGAGFPWVSPCNKGSPWTWTRCGMGRRCWCATPTGTGPGGWPALLRISRGGGPTWARWWRCAFPTPPSRRRPGTPCASPWSWRRVARFWTPPLTPIPSPSPCPSAWPEERSWSLRIPRGTSTAPGPTPTPRTRPSPPSKASLTSWRCGSWTAGPPGPSSSPSRR